MPHLTESQKKWWNRLQEIIKAEDASNPRRLHIAIRQLAIEVIAASPYQDKILLGTQKLRLFGPGQEFATKSAFLQHHQKNHTWGEDSLLFPLLDALGYEAVVHLADLPSAAEMNPTYSPFEPSYPPSGLSINMVNRGSVSGGTHWELMGESTPGDGNCMYHMVAQQVQKDMAGLKLSVPTQTVVQSVANVSQSSPFTQKASESVKVVSSSLLDPKEAAALSVEHMEAMYTAREKVDSQREVAVKDKFQSYSTEKLIAIYQQAIKNLVGTDTYLTHRPEESAKEQGSTFMRDALTTGQWDKGFELLLREELLHALGKEAWRNPVAYKAFMSDYDVQKNE